MNKRHSTATGPFGGNSREISKAELAEHITLDDAWICLKGKVYNVTKYINEHPGGVSQIEKGFGKDATEMFNRVHPSVNFEKILKGQQQGVLEGWDSHSIEGVDANDVRSHSHSKKLKQQKTGCCSCRKSGNEEDDDPIPDTKLFESENTLTYVVMIPNTSRTKMAVETDWTVGVFKKKILIIKKGINASEAIIIAMRLLDPLVDDTICIKFEEEFKVIEITLLKPVPAVVWKKIGFPEPENFSIMDSRATTDSYEAYIAHKQKINSNIYLMGIRLKPCAHFGVPIGFHIKFLIGDTEKPYTPVCYSILGDHEPNLGAIPGQLIWFIIKIYNGGQLTPRLDLIPVTVHEPDSPKKEYTLRLGSPGGSFDMDFLADKKAEVVFLLAGGTGITPMVRIIQWFLNQVRNAESSKQVILIYWNKREEDIIWNDVWGELAKKQKKWFYFFPILTQPNPKWEGLVGRANGKQIQEIVSSLPSDVLESNTKKGYICGCPGFNTSVQKALTGIIKLDDYHVFAG